MPRSPDNRIEEAFELYKKGFKLVEIARQLNIPEGTIRCWKKRYKWDERINATLQKNKRNVANKKGGQPGNKNAVGNKGGAAPEENKNAEKHGFFSKWLPEETREIMKSIERSNPIDLLWDNIQLQYTAIIRAQRLMYVKDQQDKTIEKVGYQTGNIIGEKWEVQQAWDKHATFLQAQSRAMKTLESMIKQYDELLKSDLATEEQKLRVQKLKTEISILKGEGGGDDQEGIDNFIKATTMRPDEIKEMFEGDEDENIPEEE